MEPIAAQLAYPHIFLLGFRWVCWDRWASGICMGKPYGTYIEAHPFLLKRNHFFINLINTYIFDVHK